MSIEERAALRDKLFLEIVEERGTMAVYYHHDYLKDARRCGCQPDEDNYVRRHGLREMYLNAVEAWHFASRLTPDALTRALEPARQALADEAIPF